MKSVESSRTTARRWREERGGGTVPLGSAAAGACTRGPTAKQLAKSHVGLPWTLDPLSNSCSVAPCASQCSPSPPRTQRPRRPRMNLPPASLRGASSSPTCLHRRSRLCRTSSLPSSSTTSRANPNPDTTARVKLHCAPCRASASALAALHGKGSSRRPTLSSSLTLTVAQTPSTSLIRQTECAACACAPGHALLDA
ncbi:hypothetical protein DMC30DRAFT_22254 [Rhodotorula diobovata]|uniref:Uncharacterized protein n=1 Tax=Rhodotorula diobovata TaxID=5288 RepID=A0A5C5G552_9BASI|nr:hypothetical protein DMC30DRAFT_22254 [Rhodotorula diobovata]